MAASDSHSLSMSASTSARSAGSRPHTASDLQQFQYDLHVRQQPKHARLCASGDKQPKGPIDPSPVVRLRVSDRKSASETDPFVVPSSGRPGTSSGDKGKGKEVDADALTSASYIQSPYLFCFAALCREQDEEEVSFHNEGKTRCLVGNTVSSLYHLRDPQDGSAEGFFVFPDIGVTVEGSFRLKLSLYEIIDSQVIHCNSVYTDPFKVYTAKKYPGAEDSTELSKSFANQGLKMRVKGGTTRTSKADLPSRPATTETASSRMPPQASSSSLKRPNTAIEPGTSDHHKRRLDLSGSLSLATHREENEGGPPSYATASVSSPFPLPLSRPPYPPQRAMPPPPVWDERYMTGRAFTDGRPSTGHSLIGAEGRPLGYAQHAYGFEQDRRQPSPQSYPPEVMGPPRRPSLTQTSPILPPKEYTPREGTTTYGRFSQQPGDMRGPYLPPPPSALARPQPIGSARPGTGNDNAKITLPSLADMIGRSDLDIQPRSQPYRSPLPPDYPHPPGARMPDHRPPYDNGMAAAFEAKYSGLNPLTGVASEEDARYYQYQNKARHYLPHLMQPASPHEVDHTYPL